MAFVLHQPASIEDTSMLLARLDDRSLLAGGMTLLPTIKQRLANPSDLIDLAKIPGLSDISISTDFVTIGAMTRHADIAASSQVTTAIPALAALAGGIGDPQVRHRGTLGGSIANNDPAADYPAAVLGLSATVVTDKREILANDFFTGMFDTALTDDELITAVRFPICKAASYAKFRSPASRYALVGVFVARLPDGVRVAVTGAGPCVFRSGDLEDALNRSFTVEAIDRISIDPSGLNSDIHADRNFRANLVMVMTRQAIAAAVGSST